MLDLFAGCGGLTEGFHQFRPDGAPVFHSVGAVEWDKAAAASYAMNFGASSERKRHFPPTKIFRQDIVGWEPEWKEGEIDVVVGGPPCQGFSALNRYKVGAERNKLWQEFIRIVVAVQPKVFVIENVDRFVRSPEFEDLHKRIGSGDLRNYTIPPAPDTKRSDTEQEKRRRYLLNAADYGAPQARRRAIVIAVRADTELRTDLMQYPDPTHDKEPLRHAETLDGLEVLPLHRALPWNTVEDLFAATSSPEQTELLSRSKCVAEISETLQGPFRTTDLHFTRKPEAVSLARYAAIPEEGNRKNLEGRFLCEFRDGEELIVEKEGPHRRNDDELVFRGWFREVRDGVVPDGARRLQVTAQDEEPTPVAGRSGRSKAVAYGVTMKEGDRRRRAVLTYLSTESWDAHKAGSGDVMGRLRTKSPSVTIRTEFFKPEKGRYLHPTEDRPITHYEAARLQGFPEDFRWCGSKTEIARQIGNAVPIPLGTAIAKAIYEYLGSARNDRRARTRRSLEAVAIHDALTRIDEAARPSRSPAVNSESR